MKTVFLSVKYKPCAIWKVRKMPVSSVHNQVLIREQTVNLGDPYQSY